ncbi:nucleotidyltransferase family protein [Thiococcus pfennigii]|uniref:nucleotidyltransferase domain-containing protein n=1 Tax=Thiococcus pfennigii TaxID=1057 RepID=UPI0019066377|nr:nucleotidyltransferase family protein [Thiococcus pfennigii]MBK1699562.1 hypothetical protein [Thiococcus pfennigii]
MLKQIAEEATGPCCSGSLRAEHQLILCCARTSLEAAHRERARQIAQQRMDWDYLLQRALRHKVLPLLSINLQEHCLDLLPSGYCARLQSLYKANAANALLLTAHLHRLCHTLNKSGIRSITYKGPTLAYQAYGDIGYRQFNDLDLLVRRSDYNRSKRALCKCGFELIVEYDWECTFRHKNSGIHVDLHRSLTPDWFAVHLDFEAVSRRLKFLAVGGNGMWMPCPEDMLTILAIQLAKDAWAHEYKPVQLGKACDLAELLRRHPDMNWDQIRRDSSRLGYQGILAVGVHVAHRVLGAALPPLKLAGVRSADTEILVRDVSSKLMNLGDATHGAHLSQERFHFKIRERWRDRLQPYVLNFRKRLPPNRRDYEFIRLPDEVAIVYWVVRPIRLLRDYGVRAISVIKANYRDWGRRS